MVLTSHDFVNRFNDHVWTTYKNVTFKKIWLTILLPHVIKHYSFRLIIINYGNLL